MSTTSKKCPICLNEYPFSLFRGDICTDCYPRVMRPHDPRSDSNALAEIQQDNLEMEERAEQYRRQNPGLFARPMDKVKKPRLVTKEKSDEQKQKEATQELARRALARKHLLPFVKRFNEEYVPGWVHADICQRLEQFSQDVVDKKSPRLMLFMPPRHGKELAHSTPMLTANRGWTTHGELTVGDTLFHPSGDTVRVMQVADKEHVDDYVVHFARSAPIRCHENHEWAVMHPDGVEHTHETHELVDYPLLSVATLDGCGDIITGVTVEPNGEKGRCIQVSADDGLYCAGRSMVATHNSELASKTFPAWHMGRNPKHEVIACSYSSDLAMDFSRKVRGVMREEAYLSTFTDAKLDKSSQSAERWNTEAGGGFVAAGVGGGITGRGAHVAIIDDPLKNREEAENPTTRQKIKDWFTSTLYTRLAPGGGLLIILTRWHDDDLAGWLLKTSEEDWQVIRYPAIATEDEEYRKEGEALHPARYPLSSLQRIKTAVGPRDWAALYQQNPVPDEGAYFGKNDFRYYDTLPPRANMRIYQAWDFAIGTKEYNDYSVGATIGVDQDDKVYLLNVCRGKWSSFELVDKVIDEAVNWKAQIVGLEKGQISMALGPLLDKRMQERSAYFAKEELKTGRQDKQLRARPLQGRMQQGMVLFPQVKLTPWFEEVYNEMLRFPAGEHDDCVDALAWCFQMLQMFTVVRDPKPKPKKSWRDSLAKYTKNSSRRSYMTG